MQPKPLFIAALFLIFWSVGLTQNSPISRPLDLLLKFPQSVYINGVETPILPIALERPFDDHQNYPQVLVKHRERLLVWVGGTGRLYQLVASADSLKAVRLDSTIHYGYNFGAATFSLRDTLYSMGGYGFWHFNSHLRYFNPTSADWQLIPLDQQVPSIFPNKSLSEVLWLRNFAFIDSSALQVWIGLPKPEKTGTKKPQTQVSLTEDEIWMMDMVSRQWALKGTRKVTNTYLIAQCPWGLLVGEPDQRVAVLDIVHNRVWRGKPAAQAKIARLHSAYGKTPSMFFFRDSTLYALHLANDFLDSITFISADFEKTDLQVYQQSANVFNFLSSAGKWTIYLLASMLLAGMVWWYRKRRPAPDEGIQPLAMPTTTPPGEGVKPISYPTQVNYHLLDEREKSVLDYLLSRPASNPVISADELNRLLGVAYKTAEVQKKKRSDAILSINQKLALITGNAEPFIEKQRHTTDRRIFEYYISAAKRIALLPLLNKHSNG